MKNADALRTQIALCGYVVCGNETRFLFWRRWDVEAFSDGHARFADYGRPGSRKFRASHADLSAALSQLLLKVQAAEGGQEA